MIAPVTVLVSSSLFKMFTVQINVPEQGASFTDNIKLNHEIQIALTFWEIVSS